ncbi:DNA internalization-related competence protein ComEC/Rec2 [Chloroflexota bacterium]
MFLIYLSCAWVVGIFLGSNFNLPLTLSLTGLIPIPLLFFTRRYRKSVILFSLSLFLFFAASAYAYSSLYAVNESSLHFYNDRGSVEIKGTVVGDPDVRDKNTRLNLSVTEINLDGGWHDVDGTALIFVPRYPAYKYGDGLLVMGELKTPPMLDDFDYRGYLAHQGIHATMLYPGIELLDDREGFKPLAWVYSLRGHLAQNLARVLPEPQASLAQGIVLGIRGNIPQSLRNDFASSGTAHLLAISGLHLSIMAGILLSVGIWLFGRRYYLYVWLALVAIWLYVLITGMHLPVIRSAIMASLFLVAELLGRQRSAIVALTFAAAIMVGVHPYILGDASFQLSFLAMAGLVFLFPVFRNLGRGVVVKTLGEEGVAVSLANIAVDSLSVTLGAVIAVWPVVAYYFGIISLAGPLATFLTLPALPGVIVIGILTAVLGSIALTVAQVMGWFAWIFLSYMILVVNGLAAPSISSVEADSINVNFIWGYYLFLAAGIWLNSQRKKILNLVPGTAARLRSGVSVSPGITARRKWIILPLLVIAVLVSCTAAMMPDTDLHVAFLDVGEGDAILVQKGSQQVLVDGGSSPQAISMELGRQMPFWDRTIDVLVLTHPHNDHLAGLVEVLRRYRVGQVISPALDYDSTVYDEWLRLIKENNIKHTVARVGQQIDLGDGVIMKVLNPPAVLFTGTDSDIDNNGVVMRLSTGDISFLFTGDMMREAERELMRRRSDLSSTVLKVAHHGADTSTTLDFLAVVNPQVAVISVGEDNRYGHPGDEVISRLEQKLGGENIYRTDEHGTIELTTNGERLWGEMEIN